MSSHFATATTRRNSPSWCKPGMFTGIVPTVDGKPATVSAYARWTGDYYGIPFDVIETFALRRNQANNGWAGESASSGKRVTIDCLDTALPDQVDVTLNLYDDDSPYDSFTWRSESNTVRPPWGTKPLNRVNPPEKQLVEVLLLA